ncbi:hypothetical protein ABW20_dc0106697 [Dactylellina cionopaga]|nr:hypothetical protein ABW20_dc0106697 [Dactylellina cionopaga]
MSTTFSHSHTSSSSSPGIEEVSLVGCTKVEKNAKTPSFDAQIPQGTESLSLSGEEKKELPVETQRTLESKYSPAAPEATGRRQSSRESPDATWPACTPPFPYFEISHSQSNTTCTLELQPASRFPDAGRTGEASNEGIASDGDGSATDIDPVVGYDFRMNDNIVHYDGNLDRREWEVQEIVRLVLEERVLRYEVRWKPKMLTETALNRFRQRNDYRIAHRVQRGDGVVYLVEWENGFLTREELKRNYSDLLGAFEREELKKFGLLKR